MSSSQVVQTNIMGGNYQSGLANFMSPGEATYFLMASFTANSFMSKTVGNFTDPEVAAALKIAFAETDEEKLKRSMQIDALPCRHLLLHLDRLFRRGQPVARPRQEFRPSRGLTINVYDVTLT